MRNLFALFAGALALTSAANAAIIPGTVGFQMGLYSDAGEYLWIDDVLLYNPGTTPHGFASPAGQFLSDITVDVTVEDVTPTTRTLTFDVFADDPTGQFFPSGVIAVNGSDVIDFAFSFGMNLNGFFPGAPNTPFFDADLIEILGVSGNLYSSTDEPFTAVDVGLFYEEFNPGEFGGRIFFFSTDDDGNPDIGVTEQDLSRYSVTITYSIIPAPGGAAMLGVMGLTGAFRRRR